MICYSAAPFTSKCARYARQHQPKNTKQSFAACPQHQRSEMSICLGTSVARQSSRVRAESQQRRPENINRRHLLLQTVSFLGCLFAAAPAYADDADLLPTSQPPASKLPKAYQLVVRNVIKNLRESIVAEAEGAPEYEVRRKADPAKQSVQEFVRQWRDNQRVSNDITHNEITGAIRELGQYYQKNGQRVSLTRPVRESVLGHLAAAEAALPEEADTGKFLGLF